MWQLAKVLVISVITTTRAYSDPEAEGFIATMQGKGTIFLSKDNEMIKAFSKSMKTKLMFASVLSRETKLLILDEPTGGGLDKER